MRLTAFVLALGLPLLVAPTARGEQSSILTNDELPLPESFYTRLLKSVHLPLKGHVSLGQSADQSTIMIVPQPQVSPEQIAPNAVAPQAVQAQTTATSATAGQLPSSSPNQSLGVMPPPLKLDSTQAINIGTYAANDAVAKQFDELTQAAHRQNEELQKYVTTIGKYSDWKYRLFERSKDMLNYSCLFKGVSPSSEAGDVILDEKTKLKSLAAAKYLKQKLADQIELQVTNQLLELSAVLGKPERREAQLQAERALQELYRLAGKEETDKTVTTLKSLLPGAVALAAKHPWSIAESKSKLEAVVAAAAKVDPIVADIAEDVHHYNQHSTGTLAGHRVARVALSVASMAPNLIGPAAQVVLFGYITVTGGTEQEKMLRELYIDKRLSSRAELLNEQAHLALYNYQVGALTSNQLLVLCAQRLLAKMTAGTAVEQVLGSTPSSGAPPRTVGQAAPAVVQQ